jgi:hypothetical protein
MARLAEDAEGDATLPDMVRRNRPDALQPLRQPTWLVVRNKHRQPLESRQLVPCVDLRAVLQAALIERTAAGWNCTIRPGVRLLLRRAGRSARSDQRRTIRPCWHGHQSHSAPG